MSAGCLWPKPLDFSGQKRTGGLNGNWGGFERRFGKGNLSCNMDRFTINSLRVDEKNIASHLPHLEHDIRAIVKPESQPDPTFQTTRQYRRITAPSVRKQLRERYGYTDDELPTVRTILSILNRLDYRPRKVVKSKPKKKLPQTDAIFHRLHSVNHLADTTPGYLRLSLDTKATIRRGPYSRGGYNRQQVEACDHDFAPDAELTLFGILLPASDDLWFFFTERAVTADFMADRLDDLWPELRRRFRPHTLVLNMDNGPETQSHRTQLLKRLGRVCLYALCEPGSGLLSAMPQQIQCH